jgi:hypothetical protein
MEFRENVGGFRSFLPFYKSNLSLQATAHPLALTKVTMLSNSIFIVGS